MSEFEQAALLPGIPSARQVVIGTHESGDTMPHPCHPGRAIPLHVAEVVAPALFWSGEQGVLWRSSPSLRLNACAAAVAWAKANGYHVLGHGEARRAAAAEAN